MFTPTLLVLAAFALQSAGPGAPETSVFAPLLVYHGTWTVRAQHPFGGGTGPDTLENRCTTGRAFFTCEQVVNGKPAALVVFVAAKEPGKFDVDNVLPNGYASSNTDLYVKGDHWTFVTGAGEPGKTRYRTENTFTGRDHIHFEQFESRDDGKTWTQTNQGDETRTER